MGSTISLFLLFSKQNQGLPLLPLYKLIPHIKIMIHKLLANLELLSTKVVILNTMAQPLPQIQNDIYELTMFSVVLKQCKNTYINTKNTSKLSGWLKQIKTYSVVVLSMLKSIVSTLGILTIALSHNPVVELLDVVDNVCETLDKTVVLAELIYQQANHFLVLLS